MSQLSGALAALQAGEAHLRENTEELASLKARLAAEAADRAVAEALQAGKISPAQKEWALEYFRQDPGGFRHLCGPGPQAGTRGRVIVAAG